MWIRWTREDVSQYHKAENARFEVSPNGKVDIMLGSADEKISLEPWGMLKLTEKWLRSDHRLSKEQKQTLIELLIGRLRPHEKQELIELLSK